MMNEPNHVTYHKDKNRTLGKMNIESVINQSGDEKAWSEW